jgi:hypothetical protein
MLNHASNQKTGLWDMLLLSLLITLFTSMSPVMMGCTMDTIRHYIRSFIHRKYSVTLEGKISVSVSHFNGRMLIIKVFTDDFKALWKYISNCAEDNPAIREMKEIANTRFVQTDCDFPSETEGMYIVCQKEPFLLDNALDIYAFVQVSNQDGEEKKNAQITEYQLQIYSYQSNVSQIKEFIANISKEYVMQLENSRSNKRFMYTLTKTTYTDRYEKLTCWRENEFQSAKTFDHVFFEGKQDVIRKIQFFLDNKAWYDKYGIPYTLGIGMYGPPGTGKTSFIKALMNMVKDRHLINMPLSIIQTKTQLNEFYYESRFNDLNASNSIGFDKKIIVIEDIDCVGDIVMERSHTHSVARPSSETNEDAEFADIADIAFDEKIDAMDDKIKDLIKKNIVDESKKIISKCTKKEDSITLDDILNLWDGIIETPGRILVISSNHYDKLDGAIRRPGRIDITLSMNNATRPIIAEMFDRFYHLNMEPDHLDKIQSGLYSPAEIVNIYIQYKTDPDGFIRRLQENRKV